MAAAGGRKNDSRPERSRPKALLALSWPTGFSDYIFESSVNLGGINVWRPVNSPKVSAAGLNKVNLPITSTQQFFRLIKSVGQRESRYWDLVCE